NNSADDKRRSHFPIGRDHSEIGIVLAAGRVFFDQLAVSPDRKVGGKPGTRRSHFVFAAHIVEFKNEFGVLVGCLWHVSSGYSGEGTATLKRRALNAAPFASFNCSSSSAICFRMRWISDCHCSLS